MAAIQRVSIMQKIIDPHVHFFDISKGKYEWLLPQNPPYWSDKALIHRRIMPSDLVLTDNFSLQGAVHIEAGFDNENPAREIQWLTSSVYPLRPSIQFVSIGFIEISTDIDTFKKQFEIMSQQESLVGFRYIFESNASINFSRPYMLENLRLLESAQLLLEIQADFSDTMLVEEIHSILSLLPHLKVVINHAGLPPSVDSERFLAWQNNVQLFAKLPACYIKCSGFEMSNRDYTVEHVCSVLGAVVVLFGVERVMIASNFPLTVFTMAYTEYWQRIQACVKQLGLPIDKVMYLNAKRLYKL